MKAKIAYVLTACMLAAPAAATPEAYVSDPAHTFANFQIQHLGFSWVRGRFNKTSAKVTLDRAAKTGSIEAEIHVGSVDTGHAKRDELLLTEDYFNVAKFPTITFRSTNLRFKDDTLVGIDGELTMLGVTRPVSLDVTFFKCGQHPVNKKPMCGAEASTTLQRSEFGMTHVSRSLSDEVRISINTEAYGS